MWYRNRRLHAAACGAITAFAAGTAWAQRAEYVDFGTVQPRGFRPLAISANGAVVVGEVRRDRGDGWGSEARAARWSRADGVSEFGTLANRPAQGTLAPGWSIASRASDVSANGSVIVGSASAGDAGPFATHAFRWTRETGMVSLGMLNGGDRSAASGVSANGLVIVGSANDGAAPSMALRAFRWSEATGMVSLGVLNGGLTSAARAVSADGSVIVGSAHDGHAPTGGSATRAFRWTQSTGMVSLGSISGLSSGASSVSADGAVIVGAYELPEIRTGRHLPAGIVSNSRAFRWTEATGMESLVNSGGFRNSSAAAVSADGNVIVGIVGGQSPNDPYHAFRWTRATGMQTVADWLRENGVTVPEYSETVVPGGGAVRTSVNLGTAAATNGDGSVVVGSTTSGDGYIARVSSLGSGLITLTNVADSLNSSATAGAMLLGTLGTVLNGAHSRPLSRRVAVGSNAFWVAGDVGRDDHGSRDGDFGLAEIGVGRNFGPAQVNVSLGHSRARQDLTLGGRAETDGTYVLTQALIPVYGSVTATLGAYGGWGDSDVRRGYLNGGATDFSSASPDLKMFGFRARVDWENALKLASVSFTPYVDLTRSRTKLDGYTEAGGGFPARFDAREETATELRIGAAAIWPLSSTAQFVSTLEAAHRFEKSGARTTGNLVGLFGFDLPGTRYDQDWVRVGGGVEGRVGGGTASLMLNATTRGAAPSYWLSAGWQLAF